MMIFCYHKCGTALFQNIARSLAERFGLSMRVYNGMVTTIDPDVNIVMLTHSLLGFQLARAFRGVRIVRDPRDIWVSGYLYHCRCREGWCVNTNFSTAPPIRYPRVDFSREHRPERWKRDYLAGLRGKSYQQNLLERDRDAGLRFELDRYTGWTLEAMRQWRLNGPEVMEVKLESVAAAFDAQMRCIFRYLGFPEAHLDEAVRVAAAEDIARMDDTRLAANPHIYSRTLSKWRDFLSTEQVRLIESRYNDVICRLGYSLSRQQLSPLPSPDNGEGADPSRNRAKHSPNSASKAASKPPR
jgi:hypothetical protein